MSFQRVTQARFHGGAFWRVVDPIFGMDWEPFDPDAPMPVTVSTRDLAIQSFAAPRLGRLRAAVDPETGEVHADFFEAQPYEAPPPNHLDWGAFKPDRTACYLLALFAHVFATRPAGRV